MNYEAKGAELDTLNQGRMLRAESGVLHPLIMQKREAAIAKIVMHFRAGALDMILACAAELSTIEDMRVTIDNKVKQAEIIERKIHGSAGN